VTRWQRFRQNVRVLLAWATIWALSPLVIVAFATDWWNDRKWKKSRTCLPDGPGCLDVWCDRCWQDAPEEGDE